MSRLPTKHEILKRAFLDPISWARFKRSLKEYLKVTEAEGLRVVVTEEDRVDFIAAVFAGWIQGKQVFMGNPRWGSEDWEALLQVIKPDLVLGPHPEGLALGGSQEEVDFDEPALMIATGGTGGRIKYAIHTWDNLLASVKLLAAFSERKPIQAWHALPVFHVGGWMPVMRAWMTGGVVHLIDADALAADELEELPEGFRTISLVPTQLSRWIQNERIVQQLRGLDAVLIGGAKVDPELVQTAKQLGLPLYFTYGSTETAAVVVLAKMPEELGPMWGDPLPGVSVKLGEAGTLEIESPSLFHGYYPDYVQHVHCWNSGDIGQVDAEGRVRVMGRSDWVINTGGEKVNPEFVESRIRALEGILDAAVMGVWDPEWGQKMVALVVADDEVPVSAWAKALKDKLAPHQVPKEWIRVTELPRTAMGKVARSTLNEFLQQRRGG